MTRYLALLLLAAATLTAAEPDIVAIKVDEAPKLDGRLDDPCWAQVARYRRGVLAGWRADGKLQPQQRLGYVAWDDDALYVAMQAFTPDVFKLKAGAGGVPFIGDCLEIHLMTPNGTRIQFGIDIEANIGAGQVPPGTDTSAVKGASDFGLNYWSTELAIPWKVLATTPKDGIEMALNLAGNMAYQGDDRWVAISWADRFGVTDDMQPRLQLRVVDLAALGKRPKPAPPAAKDLVAIAYPVAEPPRLDGQLDDPAWKAVEQQADAPLVDFRVMGNGFPKAPHARRVLLAYDDKFLYLAAAVASADPDLLESRDDRPELGDMLRVDFAGAALGADYLAKNTRVMLPYMIPTRQAALVTERGWQLEMAIPWTDVGGKPEPGQIIPFNISGHDSSSGRLTWARVRDFRDTKAFGKLKLAK